MLKATCILLMHYWGDEMGRGGDTVRKLSIHPIIYMLDGRDLRRGERWGEERRRLRKEEKEEEMGA